MSISPLPLSYCTNVHPGRTVAEVLAGLEKFTVPIRDRFAKPLAAGLWLARPVVNELLADPNGIAKLKSFLQERGLTCHTLNAFPFGDFHSARVKENVYLPDWSTTERLDYTRQCATVLAGLLPDGVEGSISTLPLGFKGFDHDAGFVDRCIHRLIECAAFLAQLKQQTGRTIRLAIEPEPFCVLETTPEAIAFFRRLWSAADLGGLLAPVREHLGLCYDVCHQAVEFEDIGQSIRAIDAAGIRINKVHLSCALQLNRPIDNADGRAALKRYAEPRYLHQTMAATAAGPVARLIDLTPEFVDAPPADFAGAPAWRIHFHVPVNAERLGPLATTRPALREAIDVVRTMSYAPHLEVETYTWEVLPDAGPADLVAGFAAELTATDTLLKG